MLSSLGAKVVGTLANGSTFVASFEKGSDASLLEAAKQLNLDPMVDYVEANQIYTINKLPNDPRFDELYGLNNTGANSGVDDADIDAPEAWDISTGSSDTVVAVIDTGVDYNHDDLKDNYWTNPGESGLDAEGNDKRTNGIDDDNNGFVDDFRGWDFANNDNDPMDDNSHGSHCAGTIGANGDDGHGVVGVNWDVSIVGVKFLTGGGSGSLDNAVRSIDYVSTIGAKISSNSWGGGGYSAAMEEAIERNRDAGVLFIAAAGNSGTDNDSRAHYPSSYEVDNVLSVAATDKKDDIAGFSCYGVNGVDLAAPGVDILSSTPGQAYKKYSGTSMATPHVSGVAALVASTYPEADYTYIKERILKGTDPVDSLTGLVATGGRLNAYNAIERDFTAPAKVSGIRVVEAGIDSVTLTWDAVGDDGFEGMAKGYQMTISNESGSMVQTLLVNMTESNQLTARDLPLNFEGTVTVVAVDNVGNESEASDAVSFETQKVDVVAENNADSMDGVVADGTWANQEVDGKTVFSDSPDGLYARNATTMMTLAPFAISGNDIALGFLVKFDIEKKYDNAYLEVSSDGTDWTPVQTYTGEMDWRRQTISLTNYVAEDATELHVRFRLKADRSVEKDGIFIDDIKVFAARN
ncbi:S8 family serine peptidase [bacterium]|nr:S8 family serine peptidase [bacterium]